MSLIDMEQEGGVGSFVMKTVPYGHQQKEYDEHWDTFIRAIFWQQGTGKSKLIIDTMCRLYIERLIDCVVVIAPKGVHRNWVSDELPAHMWDDLPFKSYFWQGGQTKREQQELEYLHRYPYLQFLTVNYNAVIDRTKPRSTKKIKSRAKIMLKNFLSTRTLLVLDESTAVKTPGSKTSRTVWALSNMVDRKRIMSGQPVTKNPLDLFAQFRILDTLILKFKTYAEFVGRYALVIKMDKYDIVKEYKNLGELKASYDPYMTRVLKKDCLDLPEKLPAIKRYFELTAKQAKHYRELAETFLTELDTPCEECSGDRVDRKGNMCKTCTGTGTIINGTLAMVRRLRFQQITCGFVSDEEKRPIDLCAPNPNPRIQLLKQCLSENDDYGLIWAWQHYDLEGICQLLKQMKIPYVEYSGRVTDDQKAEAKVQFQNKGNVRIFLASQAAAYSGHTLHRGEFNIYYSQTDNGEHRWQSEDRTHRAGLKHPVAYLDFYSDMPIENAIMQNLIRKKIYNEQMMGDTPMPEGQEIEMRETALSKEEMQSWVMQDV